MGWSANALHWGEKARGPDPELLLEFHNASDEVIRLAGSVDQGLEGGSLWCSPSVRHLMVAVGDFPRGAGIFLPEEVQERGTVAKWNPPKTDEASSLSSYWSAFKFFELCFRHKLGIWIEPGGQPLP